MLFNRKTGCERLPVRLAFRTSIALLLFWLIHSDAQTIARPAVVSTNGSVRSSHIFGVNATLLVEKITFDQPLYYSEAFYCADSPTCSAKCFPGCNFASSEACSDAQPSSAVRHKIFLSSSSLAHLYLAHK